MLYKQEYAKIDYFDIEQTFFKSESVDVIGDK